MDSPILGQIYLFAGNFDPERFHNCDGSRLNIHSNSALFSLIGTQFGGDGRVNFCIPKIDPLTNHGQSGKLRYVICIHGIYPERS